MRLAQKKPCAGLLALHVVNRGHLPRWTSTSCTPAALGRITIDTSNHVDATTTNRGLSDARSDRIIDAVAVQRLTRRYAQQHDGVKKTTLDSKWQSWLDQLRACQRKNGTDAVRALFFQTTSDEVEFPTRGPIADELWYRLLRSAAEDQAFLEDVIQYAETLKQATGRSWHKFYEATMVNVLMPQRPYAFDIHCRLVNQFPPSPADYDTLWNLLLDSDQLLIFTKIYTQYPRSPLYPTIIPALCHCRKYDEALEWHYRLLNNGERVTEVAQIKALCTYLVSVKKTRDAKELAMSVVIRNPTIGQSTSSLLASLSRTAEIHAQEPDPSGLKPIRFSDHFCARFFATNIFTVGAVIRGLVMLGVQTLGPESLAAIVIREQYDAPKICERFRELREGGIFITQCKYNLMIRRAAAQNNRDMLESIIECDAHPDTYDDLNIQENMLAMYLNRGDERQVKRIVATILCEVPFRKRVLQETNLMLRAYLTLTNMSEAMKLMAYMDTQGISFTPKTSRHIRVKLLVSRKRGYQGEAHGTLSNLNLIVNGMKRSQVSGALVPPIAWVELLKRYGMHNKLAELRDLAIWLADHYSHTSMPLHRRESSSHSVLPNLPTVLVDNDIEQLQNPDLPPPSELASEELSVAERPENERETHDPLAVIFSEATLQAIIAWGFLAEAKGLDSSLGTDEDPVQRDPHHSWTAGLHILKELEQRGVKVRQSSVADACRQRLVQLFDGYHSERQVNRRARTINTLSRAEYIAEMKRIWGGDLNVF